MVVVVVKVFAIAILLSVVPFLVDLVCWPWTPIVTMFQMKETERDTKPTSIKEKAVEARTRRKRKSEEGGKEMVVERGEGVGVVVVVVWERY